MFLFETTKVARCLGLSLLFIVLCLVASPSFANPLLGRWDVIAIKASDLITQVSIDRYKMLQPKIIIFNEKETGVVKDDGKENMAPVEYKELGKDTWAFSIDNGKRWHEIRFLDANTLSYIEKKDLDVVITYTLKRIQK
ncbi:MAG: hypothetical protein IJS54_06625 [Desulfovibrio sp.]|nr:hypothetical protein [Desulfovibrio sp.]